MERKKAFALSAAFTAALVGIAMLAPGLMAPARSPVPSLEDTIAFGNYVLVYKNGELASWGKNTVTNLGLNHTRDVLMGRVGTSAAAAMDYLELSNGTTGPAVGDSACEADLITGIGLDAAQGTVTEQVSHTGNYSVNVTWWPTGQSDAIAKVCLSNSTANDIFFASSLLSSTVNVQSGDTLSVYYYVDVS